VTLSSTEAEFIALTNCTKYVLKFNRFLKQIGVIVAETPIHYDNKQKVLLVTKDSDKMLVDEFIIAIFAEEGSEISKNNNNQCIIC
jgi:hypothetical protein